MGKRVKAGEKCTLGQLVLGTEIRIYDDVVSSKAERRLFFAT